MKTVKGLNAEVWEQEGFRFIIYPDDHVPSHIHVIKGGEEVVIELGNEDKPSDFRENRGMRARVAVRALKICCELQGHFLSKWRKIHGQENR